MKHIWHVNNILLHHKYVIVPHKAHMTQEAQMLQDAQITDDT